VFAPITPRRLRALWSYKGAQRPPRVFSFEKKEEELGKLLSQGKDSEKESLVFS